MIIDMRGWGPPPRCITPDEQARAAQYLKEAEDLLHKLKEDSKMDVFHTEIETVKVDTEDGIGIELTNEEASMLRRVCYFNKTLSARIAERDGEDAGAEIKHFLDVLGNDLAAEGIERWDGRD